MKVLLKHNKEALCYLLSILSLKYLWGTWGAQQVKYLTLGFSSGHNLTAPEMETQVRLCADNTHMRMHPLSK